MNDIDKLPSKCRDCLCWEIAEAPYVCADCETRRKKRKGEFIRRSDVMRAFADRVRDSNNSDFARAPNWNDAVRIVDYFPAADVEPKQRWIPVTERLPECEVGTEIGNVEWISHGMVFAGCFGRGGKYRDAYFRTWTDATEGIDAKDADCWRVVTPKGERRKHEAE